MEDIFLTHKEAAALLRISPRALECHMDRQNPPEIFYVGKKRLYPKQALIAWAMSNQTNPYHQKPQADSE